MYRSAIPIGPAWSRFVYKSARRGGNRHGVRALLYPEQPTQRFGLCAARMNTSAPDHNDVTNDCFD
jgi:hypothetical protein